MEFELKYKVGDIVKWSADVASWNERVVQVIRILGSDSLRSSTYGIFDGVADFYPSAIFFQEHSEPHNPDPMVFSQIETYYNGIQV